MSDERLHYKIAIKYKISVEHFIRESPPIPVRSVKYTKHPLSMVVSSLRGSLPFSSCSHFVFKVSRRNNKTSRWYYLRTTEGANDEAELGHKMWETSIWKTTLSAGGLGGGADGFYDERASIAGRFVCHLDKRWTSVVRKDRKNVSCCVDRFLYIVTVQSNEIHIW